MTDKLKEAAEKYAEIEWEHIQMQIKAGLSPHLITSAKESFAAGAEWARKEALEMLRGPTWATWVVDFLERQWKEKRE